jgi:hypothetical protein
VNGGGGAFYVNLNAILRIYDSTLSGNSAQCGSGISNSATGTLNLDKVTLSGNSTTISDTVGGGIFNLGTATLINATLSGNSAQCGSGIFSQGTLMTNVTLSDNSADYGGGVYWSGSSGGPPTLKNTLIAHGSKGENCYNLTGSSFSLSDDGSCSFGTGRDNVNLLLGPLANNGGLTPTHLPQPGSPAIDNAGGADCPPTDQRGFTRAGQGIACDVGAVERRPTDPSLAWRVHLPVVIR